MNPNDALNCANEGKIDNIPNSTLRNPSWNKVSIGALENAVRLKFQNSDLKALLLATGNAAIIEHGIPGEPQDFFGDNLDGTGKNIMGQILMKVRAEIVAGDNEELKKNIKDVKIDSASNGISPKEKALVEGFEYKKPL